MEQYLACAKPCGQCLMSQGWWHMPGIPEVLEVGARRPEAQCHPVIHRELEPTWARNGVLEKNIFFN